MLQLWRILLTTWPSSSRSAVITAGQVGDRDRLRVGAGRELDRLVEDAGSGGDVNRDGVVSFDDLLAVLAVWGPYEPCPPFEPEDLDEDCEVGFPDLLVVLATWGPCE